MNAGIKNIKKILIVRTDRFGEFILNTPAIKAIKDRFPEACITLMVSAGVEEIVRGWPIIDEILIYPQEECNGILKLAHYLRTKKFDMAVILNPKKDFHLATFLSGIPERVGYNRKLGFLLNHKIEDCKSSGQKHEVEYNLDLIRSIGIEAKEKDLFVSFGPSDENVVETLLKENGISSSDALLVLHPWTSDPIKQWPTEKFLGLSKKIIQEIPCRLIIIGGKEEISKSKDFCVGNPGLIDFTGKLSLRQLAAFLKRSKLLISNDSGPVHMASAVKTPVIAIFRNDLPGKGPKRWGPWGEGNTVIQNSSLSNISVEEVFQKIKEMLHR